MFSTLLVCVFVPPDCTIDENQVINIVRHDPVFFFELADVVVALASKGLHVDRVPIDDLVNVQG